MNRSDLLIPNTRKTSVLLALSLLILFTATSYALTIPDCIEVIEEEAFRNTNAFQTVEIPETVTKIGAKAFAENPNLKDIYVKGMYVTLGEDCLGGKTEYRTIHAPLNSLMQTYAATYAYKFESDPPQAKVLLDYAATMLGEPYSAHDCVTYVYLCYQHIGITTKQTCDSLQKSQKGERIDKITDLMPGDIICWKNDTVKYCTHVGMYVGAGTVDGKTYSSGVFIEASRGAGKVRYNYIPATGTSYYTRNFMNAWRLF